MEDRIHEVISLIDTQLAVNPDNPIEECRRSFPDMGSSRTGQALYAVRSTEKGLLPARYMRILSIALDAG